MGAHKQTQEEFTARQYARLIGKTVTQVVCDTSQVVGPLFGLKFKDGTTAWVLADSEGNGAGWLDITTKGECNGSNN